MQYHIVNIVENMTHLIDFHGLLGVHSVIGDAQQGFLQSLKKKTKQQQQNWQKCCGRQKTLPSFKIPTKKTSFRRFKSVVGFGLKKKKNQLC